MHAARSMNSAYAVEDVRCAPERLYLRVDLEIAVRTLPASLRELWGRLARESVREIARGQGVSRGEVQRQVRQIRSHFEAAGLRPYFSPGPAPQPDGIIAVVEEEIPMNDTLITTYSMWRQFRDCRRACQLRYVEHLVPIQRAPCLSFGSIIHDSLEQWHGGQGLDAALRVIDQAYPERIADEAQRRDWHLATAMMKGYAARYPREDFEVVALEKTFEGPIVNPATGSLSRSFTLAGKVDGIIKQDGRYFLLEHKTASQIDGSYLERLWTDFQVTLYTWYAEEALKIPVAGVLYNILGKAKLQQGQGETEAEFEARRAQYRCTKPFDKPQSRGIRCPCSSV